MLWDITRLHRRAILIYLGTIVAPAFGLLWLGLRSFETQRESLATLQADKLAREMESVMGTAAEIALARHEHPVAKYFFTIDRGSVVQPALQSPPPLSTPPEFEDAEHQEQGLQRADLALASYQKLFASHMSEALALSGIARCLAQLGRTDEARAAWRKLAASYGDQRTLSHRPYGIVAAIEAGDTAGLFDQIASGRWELSGDQARYFLNELDPKRTTPLPGSVRLCRRAERTVSSPSHAPRERNPKLPLWRLPSLLP